MLLEISLPGQVKKNKHMPFKPDLEKQRAGLGSVKDDIAPDKEEGFVKHAASEKPAQDIVRFDNMEEVRHAFKRGDLPWPESIEVHGLKYNFYKSHTKGLVKILKNEKPGYVIYHVPQIHLAKAKEFNMGHWMVFLFRPEGSSKIAPHGIAFTTSSRGSSMYEAEQVDEDQQVVGDVVLLKIALPSGVIGLKGKVDTGAEISSLHVDSKPKVVGDTVRFENHNASGNVITAPLAAQQAVKSADGGVEYRPVIELDVEVNGKRISKAQFNLNDRSHMEHEVLVGQNILEKGGFLVNPSQDNAQTNKVQEDDEQEFDLADLGDDQIDTLVEEIMLMFTEDNEED